MPPRQPPRAAARPPRARARTRLALVGALLVVVLALGLYWAAARRGAPPALDPTREGVVFLGDSITSGHGLPLDATFAHVLGTSLGIPTRNAGISGDRTAGGLERLEADVLAHRPRLVVVELGVNDAFGRVPTATTLDNLRAIVRRVRQSGAGVVLVHVSPFPIAPDTFRQGYQDIAREEGAWLVEDFLSGVVPGLTTDGLHPTAEGHARLAAKLEPLLREVLGR